MIEKCINFNDKRKNLKLNWDMLVIQNKSKALHTHYMLLEETL